MNTRKQIEKLFSDYEKTTELSDFMEELESNLNDRIASLKIKGLNEADAFDKVMTELGDVSVLADELSLQRKQEVYFDTYMNTRSYMTTGRSALYAVCGLVLGAAILLPLIVWFSTGISVASISTILPFGMVSILGFVYLGLTQETGTHEPISTKRALLYVLAVALVLFGVLSALIVYANVDIVSESELAAHGAGENAFLVAAIGTLLVFVLPGLALGIFLILTEKDRRKTWVKKLHEESIKSGANPFNNESAQMRFGMISGAIWVAAIAGFILLTMTFGFKFSWTAVVIALIIQLLVLAFMTKKS